MILTPILETLIKVYAICLIPAIFFTYHQRRIGLDKMVNLDQVTHFISVWLATPVILSIMLYKFIFRR